MPWGGRCLWSAEIKAFREEEQMLISAASEKCTSGVFLELGQLFLRCPVGTQIAFVGKLKGPYLFLQPWKSTGLMALISEDETRVQNLIILE